MKQKISLEEMKQIELELLKKIDKICKEANVQYYLAGGTLLGAVRHQGFIPWDDDIDLIMKRRDYEKLKEYMKNHEKKGIQLLSYDITEGYYYPFMKIVDTTTVLIEHNVKPYSMGVYIDIFPIDGFPSNKFIGKLHFSKIMFYRKSLSMYQVPEFHTNMRYFKFLKKWWFQWSQKKGYKYLIQHIEKLATKYEYEDSKLGGCVVHGYGLPEIVSTDSYKETIYLPFEDEKFPCQKGYDEYLTGLYGDYMKLPPKEKQVTHHHYDLYRK